MEFGGPWQEKQFQKVQNKLKEKAPIISNGSY